MAIVGQINIESRRYSGWSDPRYPIGFWQGALTVTGNVSGGLIGVDLVFQQANGAARINSQMYSLERFSVDQSGGSDSLYSIGALNMGGPSNLGFLHRYSIFARTRTGGGAANIPGQDYGFMPIFLGSQRVAGTTASLSIVGANVDGVAVTFEAEGYRWSPRSVLIDGGPQRPPSGLYPA